MPWPFYFRECTPTDIHWMGSLLGPRLILYSTGRSLPSLLTPRGRVLLEKLTGFQLVKKVPSFYGTRIFITAFTSARHLSLSWASSIQSITPHPTSWRSILLLFSHLCQGLPSGVFPSGFPTKTLYTPLLYPMCATFPAHLIILDFITWRILCEEYTQEDLWPSEIKPIFLGRVQVQGWSLHQLSFPHCLTITWLHILLWRICLSYILPNIASTREFERHT